MYKIVQRDFLNHVQLYYNSNTSAVQRELQFLFRVIVFMLLIRQLEKTNGRSQTKLNN